MLLRFVVVRMLLKPVAFLSIEAPCINLDISSCGTNVWVVPVLLIDYFLDASFCAGYAGLLVRICVAILDWC